jgi:hypothetical protein
MTFIPQTFEDLTVEKEVAVRRKLAKESVAGLDRAHLVCSLLSWNKVQQA